LVAVPFLLDNPVRTYAWGSPTVIPNLLGIPPTGEPQAELWLGAHPGAPSLVEQDGARTPLAELIDKDPQAMLGAATVERFGARLPYLLKILAVEQPLSIQAHPTSEQAAAGFAAEEAAGVPVDAAHRSYRDRSHKPEMVVALTDFEALLGFRDPARTAHLLDELGAPGLADAAVRLRASGSGALAPLVRQWLEWPVSEATALVAAVTGTARQAPGELAALVRRLTRWYPGDRGVLLALLLERVHLRPGEAAFTPAGVPHAYLSGVAVEPQASSDNTLRAGLTPKHVDVAELMRILRYEPLADPRIAPVQRGPHEMVYAPGVEEFRLSRISLDGGAVLLDGQPAGVARIVLVTDGTVELAVADASVLLRRGRAAFVPAADGPATLSGEGTAFAVAPDVSPSGTAH
jgi:mannose-6-phosphate isomerase